MQLSIIIVNYNVRYFLEQCLCSVAKAIVNMDAEILVVDNNSKDGSKGFFEKNFPCVCYTWNKENVGFARANNIALQQAKGKYILFLNPDTIVPEDCFVKCVQFFEENPATGALGVYMMDGSGKFLKESKRAFPSPFTSMFKLTGLTRLFPRSKIFARYHLGNLDKEKNHEVDVIAGAYMMVPREVLDKVGSFDETFFMYGEDVDLSYRIQEAGYHNYYYAGTKIIHFKGESTKKGSLNYVRLFYKAMSIFVKKHYGGSKAGIFKLFIHFAIWLRASFTALASFIKWIGMPVLDALVILLSFWGVKWIWSSFVRQEVNYSPNMLLIAFPIFTLIFLAVSFFSGLYDNGYKQSRLNRSTIFSIVILLSGYSLLPESLRFSRGILVFGSLLAFILITILRGAFVTWQIIESGNEAEEHRQTVIVGTKDEFETARQLLSNAGIEQRILGRIALNEEEGGGAIGNIESLVRLLGMYTIREVIFCQGALTFKEIIELLPGLPHAIRVKFHAERSTGIIGSDSKDEAGGYVSSLHHYNISMLVNKRNKKLVDRLFAVLFLLSFPLHFIFQKHPIRFFRNALSVLRGKKTWVGYAISAYDLPELKPGILTSTGLPAKLNVLPEETLVASDKWYASDYQPSQDMKLVWKGYRYLGT